MNIDVNLLRKLRCSDCLIIPVFIMIVWKQLRSSAHTWISKRKKACECEEGRMSDKKRVGV